MALSVCQEYFLFVALMAAAQDCEEKEFPIMLIRNKKLTFVCVCALLWLPVKS